VTRHLRGCIDRHREENGAYAILYAALVVIMIGIAAMVVDIAGVREDRRENRAAADSAATGAAEFLNPLKTIQPKKACDRAWDYLVANLDGLTKPLAACSSFNSLPGGVSAAVYCTAASPTMVRDVRTVGNRTVVIAWPIPKDDPLTAADESRGFLTPDLAPGDVEQAFYAERDGSDGGCDRIGVALIANHKFGLAAGIGAGGTSTSDHSVARFNVKDGPAEQVAALNVLNTRDCKTVVTTGGGKVFVGPTFRNGEYAGPGIIAVESDGSGDCSGSATGPGGDRVIDPNTSSGGSLVCSSATRLDPSLPNSGCDGLGVIQSHALDPGGVRAYRGYPANLRPQPGPEGGIHGWNPVTLKYGCSTAALSPCVTPGSPEPPYIDALVSAYGGSGIPTASYAASDPLYTNPYSGAFTAVPANVCASNISTTIVLNAGNWFANCSINIANGGTLVIKGGTLVVEGGFSIAGGSTGGCFVMNINRTTCASASDVLFQSTGPSSLPDPSTAYTTLDQPNDAVVYLRGRSCGSACGFDHQGNLFMAKTFMFAENTAEQLSVNSTRTTFWTAPGAGKVLANNRTALEIDCISDSSDPDPLKWVVSEDCLNSRFSRLVYWSEYSAPKTKPNTFNGQGSLNVVGVFFTPTAYFNFTGGSSYTAAAAQFWADKLNVDGGAVLGLMPDARTAISSPAGAVSLIR
jgi:hypothetical protein